MAKKPELPPDQPAIYQLKITLEGIDPPIWRRIHVPADVGLDVLHIILQLTMGWDDSHLHQFKINKKTYTSMDEDAFEPNDLDEADFLLSDLVTAEKAKFTYEYDFGDSWEHTVVVEKILPADPKIEYPICLDGARACPPEDSGGVWSYQDKLDVLADPKHEEYAEIVDWMGEDFDPEEFSVDETNEMLSELDEYIAELDMFDAIDPQDILTMLQEGIAILKGGIEQVRRLSNGVVLDLPYDPEIMSVAFQFAMFHQPALLDTKFTLEFGPKQTVRLQITGPKEDLAQIEQILGIS